MTTPNGLLVAIAAAVLGASQLVAQGVEPLITDRPDFTEAPQVVGKGVIQLEAGATGTFRSGGQRISGPEFLARIGIGERVELRLGAPNFIHQSYDGTSNSGTDAFFTGLKLTLLDQGSTAVGVVAGVTVPSGEDDFGGGGEVPEFRVAVANQVGSTTVSLMTSALFDDRTRFEQTLVGSFPLSGTAGMFLEYAGAYGGGEDAEHTAHAGFALLSSPDLQFDLHLGVPLTGESMPFIGAGVAIRYR